MCTVGVVPYVLAGIGIALGVTNAEDSKTWPSSNEKGPEDPRVRAERQAKERIEKANVQKPIRASAADALYGNARSSISESGSMAGTPSTSISAGQSPTPQTALTLGKSDLLGQ